MHGAMFGRHNPPAPLGRHFTHLAFSFSGGKGQNIREMAPHGVKMSE